MSRTWVTNLRNRAYPFADVRVRAGLGIVTAAVLFATVLVAAGGAKAATANELIVFDTADGEHSEIYTIRPDGTRMRPLTHRAHDHRRTEPQWSADGRQIAYVSDESGNPQIWMMNRDGSNQHQVTHDDAADYARPSWSPDGRHLAVSRCPHSLNVCAIDVIETNGRGLRHIVGGAWHNIEPNFSPGGRRIVYTSDNGGYDSRAWIVNADGTHRHLVGVPVALAGGLPSWSPDGTHLTFTGNPVNGQVFTVATNGRHLRRVSSAREEAIFATYSPDGRRLVARITDPHCRCGLLAVMNVDGSHRRSLARTRRTGVTMSDWSAVR